MRVLSFFPGPAGGEPEKPFAGARRLARGAALYWLRTTWEEIRVFHKRRAWRYASFGAACETLLWANVTLPLGISVSRPLLDQRLRDTLLRRPLGAFT